MSGLDDKERVRDANDIVELVSQSVQLKQAGKNFRGLCPFHREKTPSFYVTPDRQTFKCFGCGAGGDVFEYVMRHDNLTFPEALRELAQRGHVTLSDRPSQDHHENEKARQQLYAVMAWALSRFQHALKAPDVGQPARAYLKKRQVGDEQAERFGLGFAPAGWDNLQRAGARDHYSRDVLEKAGLVVTQAESDKCYDRFRSRLIFPIWDLQGRPVGFGGRLLGPGEPKYLNSPETALFRKGELLYALNLAREAARPAGRLVLVEGYMDVMACHAAGITETVATLGTALTPQQAKLMKRYASQVVVLYDADEAGLRATQRAFELLNAAGVSVKVADLSGAKDPDDLLREQGAKALETNLAQAVSVVEFLLSAAIRRGDVRTGEGKLKIVREIGPLILQFPADGIEQGEYIHLVAERLQLLDRQVRTELKRLPGKGVVSSSARAEAGETTRPPVQARKALEEELIIATLLHYPVEIEKQRAFLDPELFLVPEYHVLLEKLLETPASDPDQEEDWLPEFKRTLAPELAELATRLAAVDRGTVDPDRVIQDCLNRLLTFQLQERRAGLEVQIRDAKGDLETVKRLFDERKTLDNRLNSLGPVWKSDRRT